MRVLLVTSHLNAGGITSYILSLASALKRRGCEVFLASGGGQFEEDAQFPHYNIGIRTKCEIGLRVLKGALRLKKILKDENIDLVHAQTRVAAVTSWLASRSRRIPLITTAHGFYRLHWGRRLFPCWGQAVIAISSQVLEHLKRDFHVPDGKVRLIYNGTDFSKYEGRPSEIERKTRLRQLGLVQDVPLIGIIARLSPVKGHRYLLEALSGICKIRPVQCLIVGDGPSRADFLNRLESLKLDGAVRWIPWVDNTADILGLLDIFVLPSLQEGLSLSILEAQASGIPVVASNVGGISEVVLEGETGLLVPPKDSMALKEAILKLLENRPLIERMGETARERVREKFSLDRMADQVISVYQRVLSPHTY